MKYDPIELMKLNITEADIQEQRDFILKLLTESPNTTVITMSDPFWLPFIIDMFTDFKTTIQPCGHMIEIKVILEP